MKTQEITDAEAGSIFIAQKFGKQGWLIANLIQNGTIKLRKADFRIPIVPASIAGYVDQVADC